MMQPEREERDKLTKALYVKKGGQTSTEGERAIEGCDDEVMVRGQVMR